MEHAHSAVAVLVQATHELNRHSFPDVHLERVVLPAKFEVSCLDRLPALCRLDGDRVVELRVPPGTRMALPATMSRHDRLRRCTPGDLHQPL
ncbi:MAG: hypothetical protein ACK56F_19270, partial [bacterium]